jgi:1-deoxy-D-xylulose-5-phosphate synthase
MGCGVAFEALNHAGSLEKERLLVILNDNRWSIAKTVGALSRHLNKLRSGSFYNRAKDALRHLIQSIPLVGRDIDRSSVMRSTCSRTWSCRATSSKSSASATSAHRRHDVGALLEALATCRSSTGSCCCTCGPRRARVCRAAKIATTARTPRNRSPRREEAREGARGALRAAAGRSASTAGRSWTEWFGEGLQHLAEKDPRVIAITAAMPDGTGLMEFRDKFPDRFVDAGIAEQHAVALASGMATAGMRPVCAIYSTFLQRGYDQVFQEVILQRLPVVFAMDRGGLVGEDGATHNGLYDLSYLRCMPGIVLMAPKDGPSCTRCCSSRSRCRTVWHSLCAWQRAGTTSCSAGTAGTAAAARRMEILREAPMAP